MGKAKILPSGNWRCRAYIGKDKDGKKVYKSFTAPTRKEAELMAAQAAVCGKTEDTETITIGQAVRLYIESKENVLSPSTIEGYRKIERNRIPDIADICLDSFDTKAAQKYINKITKSLSPKSVSNTWGLLSSAIKLAEPEKHLAVTLPAKRKNVRDLPSPKEVIDAVKGTDVELPAMLAMWLSLRLSEVRGIKYKDIKNGVLSVRRTVLLVNGADVVREQTKTYGSTRRLKLPPYLVRLIGTGNPDDFVVKMSHTVIYNRFVSCIENAGLPHMRFHDLRHLNASVMLQLGIPEKYAMERGGWTTNSTLQNVYQHTFSAEREAVDEKIDSYFERLLG